MAQWSERQDDIQDDSRTPWSCRDDTKTFPLIYQKKEEETLGEILRRAGKRALGGGIPGAAAMGVQVVSLMWLRTTVNYQYRYATWCFLYYNL